MKCSVCLNWLAKCICPPLKVINEHATESPARGQVPHFGRGQKNRTERLWLKARRDR